MNRGLTIKRVLVAGVLVVVGSVLSLSPLASADRFDEQIQQLQQENNNSAGAQAQLQTQALDLQSQVAALQAEIAALDGQIAESERQKADTEAQITKAEADLAEQKRILGEVVGKMYTDGGLTTIEMLATSDNISEYIDKQEYRTNVQNQVVDTANKIGELQKELAAKKLQIEQILADQSAMRATASANRSEVSRLLSLNQQQQADYNASIANNNKQITELKRQQAIENAKYNIGRPTIGGTGGYPWANVAYPSSSVDPWGMFKRECVSYTAWRVATSGRHMPYWGGRGNAKLWDDNARAANIPVDDNPQVGDIAVSNAGRYGHVMYVEAVHSDGTITVSQYNASWDGNYSMVRRAVGDLVFIHFP